MGREERSGCVVKVTIRLLIPSRFRISGTTPTLLHTPSWCPQKQLCLYFVYTNQFVLKSNNTLFTKMNSFEDTENRYVSPFHRPRRPLGRVEV